ncbi:MAG: hypothetical protein JSS20_02610 [Proteobacteria bacterium]|nr:hypothetical protein [Pseudomonadota bacterium]
MKLYPAAIYPTVDIKDETDLPFKRKVASSATYDGFTVEGPHWLIEHAQFSGPVGIMTRLPMVLRGVSIRPETKAPWALHTWPEAGRVLFLWSDAGASSTVGAPNDHVHHLERALYLRSERTTVYRSHIHSASDGIQLHAPHARVIETLIDGLVTWKGDHNDGIQMLGRGADLEVLRSRIDNQNSQTSCLNLIGDRVTVRDSYLAGGGWTVYGGASGNGHGAGTTKSVVFTGNVFGRDHFAKSGSFGPVAYWDHTRGSGNRWEKNRWSTGEPIKLKP